LKKFPLPPPTGCCPYRGAAEQKARLTYDNILRLSDDPDVNDVIRFLREREIVHFQRFGDGKRTRGREKELLTKRVRCKIGRKNTRG